MIVAVGIGTFSMATSTEDEKITIDHKGVIIEINKSALEAHLKHGDKIMILYKGEWMTEEEYDDLMNQSHMNDVDPNYGEESSSGNSDG